MKFPQGDKQVSYFFQLDNSGGKCHIFRQLMAICKDMAETIIALDRSLKDSMGKFMDEDKSVYLELFKTEEDLITACK